MQVSTNNIFNVQRCVRACPSGSSWSGLFSRMTGSTQFNGHGVFSYTPKGCPKSIAPTALNFIDRSDENR
jgi:hypothetical protein